MVRNKKRQDTDNTEATSSNRQSPPKTDSDTETTVLTNPTGTLYPAIDTRDFGNTPVQVIEYLQINKIVAPPLRKNAQMEENVRDAELKFMADLRTIIKETSRDRELIATMIALENKDENNTPDNYIRQYRTTIHKMGDGLPGRQNSNTVLYARHCDQRLALRPHR